MAQNQGAHTAFLRPGRAGGGLPQTEHPCTDARRALPEKTRHKKPRGRQTQERGGARTSWDFAQALSTCRPPPPSVPRALRERTQAAPTVAALDGDAARNPNFYTKSPKRQR